jgi:hypothetical protein
LSSSSAPPQDGIRGQLSAAAYGKPTTTPVQNAFAESFIGRLRDELLNETLFRSVVHARSMLEVWRADYNHDRPHSRLGWLSPATYATQHPPMSIKPTARLQSSLNKKVRGNVTGEMSYWRISEQGPVI